DKSVHKVLLIRLQRLLPSRSKDDYSLPDGLRVRQELVQANNRHRQLMRRLKCRTAGGVTVSCLVNSLDQITRLLKFDREEEGAGAVYPMHVDASRVETTVGNVLRPEIEAGTVRHPTKKIQILLARVEWSLI